MSEGKRLNVRLLSDVCMQSRLLKDALESRLPIGIDISPFNELWQHENDPACHDVKIIIIDYSCIDSTTLSDYYTFKQMSCPEAKEVVINCPRRRILSHCLSGKSFRVCFSLMTTLMRS